jgi:hypothetical protein
MEILILGAIIYLIFKYPVNAAKVVGFFFLILFLGVIGYLVLWLGFILLMAMVV